MGTGQLANMPTKRVAMGLYLHMYLGPYVECVVRKQTHEVDVWGCTNVSCPQHAKRAGWGSGQKFCFECSAPCGKSTRTEPYVPWPHTVLGESEELTPICHDDEPDAFYLGTNITSPRRFHCDVDEGVHLDVSYIDREEEMQWFAERHAKDLAALAEVYDLDVCWGLHAWYS